MFKWKITICMMVLFISGCSYGKNFDSNSEQSTKDPISFNDLTGKSATVDYDSNITLTSFSKCPYIFTGKVLQRNEERDEIISNDKFIAYDIQVIKNYKGHISDKVTVYIPYAKLMILNKDTVPEKSANIISYEKNDSNITYTIQNPLFKDLEINQTYTFFIQYQKDEQYFQFNNTSVISMVNGITQLYYQKDQVSKSKFEITEINPDYTNYVTIPIIDKINDHVSGISEQDFIQQIQYKE